MSDDADRIKSLRRAGQFDAALALARERAPLKPHDARLQYEAASIHDRVGLGAQAVPYYRASLAGTLPDEDRHGAFMGLGSTLRARGHYSDALAVLEAGLEQFPHSQVLQVFRALTLYNLSSHRESVAALLSVLVRTSSDPGIRKHERALNLYASDLDRQWRDDEDGR